MNIRLQAIRLRAYVLIPALFTTLNLLPSAAQAGVIFSDFSPGQTFSLSSPGRIVAGPASSFPMGNDPAYSFTASSDASVSEIDLGLSLGAGSSVVASLWTAATGCGTGIFISLCGGLVPTTELGSWTVTSSASGGASITGITGVELTGGSTYFLQLTADTPSSYGVWANNLVGATSTVWQCGGDTPCAGDATIGITTTGTFDVLSPTSAPEPASVWLFVIGMGGLSAFMGRRRLIRKRRSAPDHCDTLVRHTEFQVNGGSVFVSHRSTMAQLAACRRWSVFVLPALLACPLTLKSQGFLVGLSGMAGGGSSSSGLVLAGTGFSSLDLTAKVENPLIADANPYVATAFAANPALNIIYMEKEEADGFHLVAVSAGGSASELYRLPLVFKFFVYDAATNSLLGLAGSGGGSVSDDGFISAGTGFYSFNLNTNSYQLLAADTNQYVNTAFTFDPRSQTLYVEQELNPFSPSPTFELVAVYAAGGESNIFPLSPNFIFFAFNSATNSLVGLAAGSGGGSLTDVGLVTTGAGFFSFNLNTNTYRLLAADTNQYANTAFAFDPGSQTLYAEQGTNPLGQPVPTNFALVGVNTGGGEFSVATLPKVLKLFAVGLCPANVSLASGSVVIPDRFAYMVASFLAPSGTLDTYKAACNFLSLNWQQQFTFDPGGGSGSKVQPTNPQPLIDSGNVIFTMGTGGSIVASPLNGFCSSSWTDCSLIAGGGTAAPPYYDPPDGGYLGVGLNTYPFYYPDSYLTPGPPGICTIFTFPGYCPLFPYIVSSDNKTLSFEDNPARSSLPTGSFLAFKTTLVGISNVVSNQRNASCGPGKALYCTPLASWTWKSTFNGTAGGVDVNSSGVPIDPGSGTGGVTITSINGVQLPSVVLPSQIATTASGLAYSRVSQTFNGTVTVTNITSSAISGPLQILFMGMPPNVTLVNATRNLSGTPYLTVPAITSLAPGQSVTVSVQFQNPSNATINLSPVIYSGSIN